MSEQQLVMQALDTVRVDSMHASELQTASWTNMPPLTIGNPTDVSMQTALALFELEIPPIASHGEQSTWKHLKHSQLEAFDKLKANFPQTGACCATHHLKLDTILKNRYMIIVGI